MRELYIIEQICADKSRYLPLLLLADPSEEMIARYLDAGDMFLMRDNGEMVGVAVVDQAGELKNLAIAPEWQAQGCGKGMVDSLCRHYCGKFEYMYVGTSNSGVEFYKKCGFEFSHTVKNFFTDSYPEPLIEDGVQCMDMIYLRRRL